jgi:D-alanine-D-alanine ligase
MRIAFTHNLQLSNSEEEAEFDRPETVAALSDAMRRLGHEVEPLEVSGTASRVVARLEALDPDLVFNTAEGTRGRFREAFYPALFDRLGIPFTGSDAYVCALTLDKQLTKMVVSAHGIPTPKGIFITDAGPVDGEALPFPMIIKPNFEGSSIGITAESVVENPEELRARVVEMLARYPAGLLVEEFIVGRDLVVPYIEGSSPATCGVLEPAGYEYPSSTASKYQIYDYDLKSKESDSVRVKIPADIPEQVRRRVVEFSRTVFRVLDVRDVGRIDFRLNEKNEIYFIEINALPSLEQGASIYASAARAGLVTMEDVLGAILESAAERFHLSLRTPRVSRRSGSRLRVGLTFNLRRTEKPTQGNDLDAEYDSPKTIAAIRGAIESYGHQVVELEATPELPSLLSSADVDLVFNIAEGFKGRHRESQIPALLELLGIPYTGSDPTALSLALDKGLAKRLVRQAGFPTPPFVLLTTGRERLPKDLSFPVIVKPVAEGSSKGILQTSVVESEAELRTLAVETAGRYRQAVIAENFVGGREFTVGLLGEKRPKALPPMEILFEADQEKYPVYSFSSKFESSAVRYEAPAKVDPALDAELRRVARGVFAVLGCRDVARVDLRLDDQGRVHFIECNPLPGLSPGFSDLCFIAEAAGIDYRTLIGEILAPCIRRWHEQQREKRIGREAVG